MHAMRNDHAWLVQPRAQIELELHGVNAPFKRSLRHRSMLRPDDEPAEQSCLQSGKSRLIDFAGAKEIDW